MRGILDIANITDILGIGINRYVRSGLPAGTHQIRFIGRKVFMSYYSRFRWEPAFIKRYISRNIDGSGDEVIERNIGDSTMVLYNLRIILYRAVYLEFDGEVIFDKR